MSQHIVTQCVTICRDTTAHVMCSSPLNASVTPFPLRYGSTVLVLTSVIIVIYYFLATVYRTKNYLLNTSF